MKKYISLMLALMVIFLYISAAYASQPSNAGITVETKIETLDKQTFDFLRNYYNDPNLSNEQLFERFVELKKSYITALDSLYNANKFTAGENCSETVVRVFYEGIETLFGAESYVYLYNVAVYSELEHNEQTLLHLIVPVSSNNSVMTVSLKIPRELLGKQTAEEVASILSEISCEGLEHQQEAPAIFKDISLMEKVKEGIYPALSQKSPTYVRVEDRQAGCSYLLPESYVPFIQNKLGGILTYSSYKIDPRRILSISSAPKNPQNNADSSVDQLSTSIPNTVDQLSTGIPNTAEVLESGEVLYGCNSYIFIFYRNEENNRTKYYYDYYIQGISRLYRIQLKSCFWKDTVVLSQMEKILEDFHTWESVSDSPNPNDITMLVYENREEGYSFKYPSEWTLEDVSTNIDYDRLRLNVPGYSGTLEIVLQERDISVSNISMPLFSDFSEEGFATVVRRLGAFTDDNARNRLFFSVDIHKANKIYSLSITSGEYMMKNGIFDDEKINEIINLIAASFHIKETPEAEARALAGETRNRKLVFIENELRNRYGPGLTVYPADNIQPDGTVIISVENIGDSGFYKIKPDYINKNVEVLERVLKRDILRNELKRLLVHFEGMTVTGTFRNEANMTVSVQCIEEGIRPVKVMHTYHVDARPKNGEVIVKTSKITSPEDYISECKAFVKSKFPAEVDVYIFGSNTFSDVDIYQQKGVDYRILAYYQGNGRSGFFKLSMDPVTGVFTARESFIPLAHIVENIKYEYGIKSSDTASIFSFDPETFVLTLFAPSETASASLTDIKPAGSVRQFGIFYHLEDDLIRYKKINSPWTDMH